MVIKRQTRDVGVVVPRRNSRAPRRCTVVRPPRHHHPQIVRFLQATATVLVRIQTDLTYLQGGPKTGPQTHDHNSVKSSPIYKFFFTGRFLGKFAVKRVLKILPHLAYVATLPCETLVSAKQAINDK